MSYAEINRETDVIPIMDSSGKVLSEIKLKEKIMPIPRKRGGFSEKGIYYKGAGIVYRNHLGCDYNFKEEYEKTIAPKIIGKTDIIYENLILCYQELVGKFGIFTFKHQPMFSDYEGACGIKEKKIVQNQKEFELSAIESIVDIIPTGLDNTNIYAYKLKTNLKGNLDDTVNLIRYVLENDWNTAWDKNLWEDIECFGYVRDVADWYRSERFEHKLGTVFALLNSLYKSNKTLYARLLLKLLNTYNFNKKMMLVMSSEIVKKYSGQLNKSEYDHDMNDPECFEKLYNLLASGKACCHLENDSKWNWVRESYFRR